MNKIDTTNWKRFNLYHDLLFTIDSGNKFDKSKMTIINPTINFVGRSSVNNGITCVVDNYKNIKPYSSGNMTIALGGEYLGACFIQEKDFYTSQNVNVLIPKWDMSFNVKLFISFMIFKESRTYYKAFEDELNRHILTDFSILLPIDEKGNPNFDYMENYIKSIEEKAKKRINNLINKKEKKNKVNISNWKEFRVGDYFKGVRGTSRKMQLLPEGNTPIIAAARCNQGIAGYYDILPEYENAITISCNGVGCGSTFYHDYPFAITGDAIVLKNIGKVPQGALLYLTAILDKHFTCKYSYDDKCSANKAENEIIKLPATPFGEPDWDYMEKYIKKIEEKAKDKINILEEI